MADIIVIGGGPAGMMAALTASKNGARVFLLEKNEKLGKKLYISGKGRCNITNNCSLQEFFKNIAQNPRFAMRAIYAFTPDDLVSMLNSAGLPTKIERGGRIFPQSDKSSDVISCLSKMLNSENAEVLLNTNVLRVEKKGVDFSVHTGRGDFYAKSVVIATGGTSYPLTGSTGDGYTFAKCLGSTVRAPKPALSAMLEQGNLCASLQGLSLKNIRLTLWQAQKRVFSEMGEMLFTQHGISGPLVLSASSSIDYDRPLELRASIDLKPALEENKLDARLLRDFEQNKNKQIATVLTELLPHRLIRAILNLAGIGIEKPVNSITKKERGMLSRVLKNFSIEIAGLAPLSEAIVTRGGIDVKGIDPATMQSRQMPGLYFAGEVIDVDAFTGGFNMQIAFSTGYLAGLYACKHIC